ncbi:MAG: SGNH/GDSL hydrolase family protein [Anaerolineae bacterium]|nr:SGNH/GDSL hydrolase family protein [Anaerolineae bacterium]
MTTQKNAWTPPVKFLSQAFILLAGIFTLDHLGHIFVSHSAAYWFGLVLFVLLVVTWNDITPIQVKTRAETRRTRFFRLFYHGILLIFTLTVFDRIVDRIFTFGNSIAFWTCVMLALGLLSGWHTITSTTSGQRILSSGFVERSTLMLCSLLGALAALELFVESDFSRYHVFGIWPTWEITSAPAIRFELNSAGYRDIEHSLERQPGMTRILLLGDSFTAGYGVAQTDYYPVLLREGAGSSFEFIIAAQPAAETVHQIDNLRDYGCRFSPDVVIVGVVSNDPWLGIEKNSPPWPFYQKYFERLESPYSFNPDLLYMLDRPLNRIASYYGQYDYADWLDALYAPEQPWIGLWHPVVSQLADLAATCGAHHLYAFTLPEPADYSDPDILEKFERIYTTLEAGFTQAGFDTTNLFPAYLEHFKERPFHSLWAIPNDAHPNAEVHRWYAEQIWDKLEPEAKNWE